MKKNYHPTEIPAIRGPITAKNARNAERHPATELGSCTPFQLFDKINLGHTFTACVLGNPSKGMGLACAMVRQSEKPFLLIGPGTDEQSAFDILQPDWILDEAQATLPPGNGAILFSKPVASYLELCEYFEEWSRDYFIILHLSGGVRIGPEIMNFLGSAEQCLIFSDSIPQSLRSNDSRTITTKEFLSTMTHLFIFSSGIVTKDLIDILPTYQYEKVTNSLNINGFNSHSVEHPVRAHRGHNVSWGQARTMEYNKNIFEMDELQKFFDEGTLLLYSVKTNKVFWANVL